MDARAWSHMCMRSHRRARAASDPPGRLALMQARRDREEEETSTARWPRGRPHSHVRRNLD
eukprot:2822110-Pleurochrysis_carterae.AAC.1